MLDGKDPLAPYRNEFLIDDDDMLYMDGNSLGRLPKKTVKNLQYIIRKQWGRGLIRSWNRGWYDAPQRIGEKLAELLGAHTGQVIVGDSTSVNLFKLVSAALTLQEGRKKIISDELNFPSDLYVIQGCVRYLDKKHLINLIPSKDSMTIDEEQLFDSIDSDTALVTLSHVTFKSGFLYDMSKITEIAHKKGALVLWDLSHSAGVVPLKLDEWDVDFAVGCTYKYLNGGPGAPAFLYIKKNLQDCVHNSISGWFGQDKPFDFKTDYRPAQGIRKFLTGTPPVLSLLAIEKSVEMINEAGIRKIREKSKLLTSYLVYLTEKILVPLGFQLGSPGEAARRGSHVSIRHKEGYRINRALIEEMNVLPDFREPDNIRLGLAPLYTKYEDVYETVQRIKRVVDKQIYKNYPEERLPVT